MIVKKAVDRRPGHRLNGDLLGVEPDSEVLDGLNVLLNGAQRMAAFVEIIDVGFDPGTEGVGPQACANARAAEELVQHGCPPFGSKDRPGGSRIMRTRSNYKQGDREGIQAIPRIDRGELRIIADWA
jgi:hypothetical protein